MSIFTINGGPPLAGSKPAPIPKTKDGGKSQLLKRLQAAFAWETAARGAFYHSSTELWWPSQKHRKAWSTVERIVKALDAHPEMYVRIQWSGSLRRLMPNMLGSDRAIALYREQSRSLIPVLLSSYETQSLILRKLVNRRKVLGFEETAADAVKAILDDKRVDDELDPLFCLCVAVRAGYTVCNNTYVNGVARYVSLQPLYDVVWGEALPPDMSELASKFLRWRIGCLRTHNK